MKNYDVFKIKSNYIWIKNIGGGKVRGICLNKEDNNVFLQFYNLGDFENIFKEFIGNYRYINEIEKIYFKGSLQICKRAFYCNALLSLRT